MNHYEIDVAGMNCDHCRSKVEAALNPLAASVDVSLEAGTATVESARSAEELLSALKEAGYSGSLRS